MARHVFGYRTSSRLALACVIVTYANTSASGMLCCDVLSVATLIALMWVRVAGCVRRAIRASGVHMLL